MKTDFMLAITQLSAEKNLPKRVVLAAIEAALASAYKKDNFAPNQNIDVMIDPASGEVKVYVQKNVVELPADTQCEISLAEARKLNKDAQISEVVRVEATPHNAGRIAAQTAKQVILQRLHEAEHNAVYEEYAGREGDIVTGVVQRMELRQILIDLGRTEAVLPVSEQVRNERYRVGQRLKVYLLEVARTSRGPQILVSRSHPRLLWRLFELEVPEVYNGNVEVKSIAREAGYRSKVAVAAQHEGIDPVGCCVGLRGIRIQNIVNELNGEKIDVVQWHPDPTVFLANALSPAQVTGVELGEDNDAVVVVPDRHLSLAIGKEGQNARLAAKLTGWRIDIKTATVAEGERAEQARLEGEAALAELVTEELVPEPIALTETILMPGEEAETIPVEAEVVKEEVEILPAFVPQEQVEKPQIRFAEDIMPSRAVTLDVKAKEKKKKGAAKGELGDGIKPKKGRQKAVIPVEDEEYEEL